MPKCKWRGLNRKTGMFWCQREDLQWPHPCDDYHVEDCKQLEEGVFVGWKQDYKEEMGGQFVKFSADEPEHTVIFEGEPTKRMLTSTFEKGKEYASYDFPVSEKGRSKIMSVTAKGLMDLLAEEDDEESIVGRCFKIKMLGEKKNKTWKVREVKCEETGKQAELKEADDTDDQSSHSPKQKTEDNPDKEKAKFMKGVEEQKKKRAKKPKVEETEIIELPEPGEDEIEPQDEE